MGNFLKKRQKWQLLSSVCKPPCRSRPPRTREVSCSNPTKKEQKVRFLFVSYSPSIVFHALTEYSLITNSEWIFVEWIPSVRWIWPKMLIEYLLHKSRAVTLLAVSSVLPEIWSVVCIRKENFEPIPFFSYFLNSMYNNARKWKYRRHTKDFELCPSNRKLYGSQTSLNLAKHWNFLSITQYWVIFSLLVESTPVKHVSRTSHLIPILRIQWMKSIRNPAICVDKYLLIDFHFFVVNSKILLNLMRRVPSLSRYQGEKLFDEKNGISNIDTFSKYTVPMRWQCLVVHCSPLYIRVKIAIRNRKVFYSFYRANLTDYSYL